MVDSANGYVDRRKAIRNSWLRYLTSDESPLSKEEKDRYSFVNLILSIKYFMHFFNTKKYKITIKYSKIYTIKTNKK